MSSTIKATEQEVPEEHREQRCSQRARPQKNPRANAAMIESVETFMITIKEIHKAHHTELKASIGRGRARQTIRVSIPGRDVWAHQMARIQLQDAVIRQMKRS